MSALRFRPHLRARPSFSQPSRDQTIDYFLWNNKHIHHQCQIGTMIQLSSSIHLPISILLSSSIECGRRNRQKIPICIFSPFNKRPVSISYTDERWWAGEEDEFAKRKDDWIDRARKEATEHGAVAVVEGWGIRGLGNRRIAETMRGVLRKLELNAVRSILFATGSLIANNKHVIAGGGWVQLK